MKIKNNPKMQEETQTEKKITEDTILNSFFIALEFCMVPFIYFIYAFMKNYTGDRLLYGLAILLVMSFVNAYVFGMELISDGLLAENKRHLGRIVFVLFLGLCISIVFIYMPRDMWICMPLAALLYFISNDTIAIWTYTLLICFQWVIADSQNILSFIFLFLTGWITILLFSQMKADFEYRLPLFTSLIFNAFFLIFNAFFSAGKIYGESILYIIMNTVISFIVTLLLLKYYSVHIFYKRRDYYARLNDPESKLMQEMKNYSIKAYKHAIHTAHFCEIIAKRIGADDMTCKALGYYHKIGRIKGNNNLKNSLQIAGENNFPDELVLLLKEYGSKNTVLKSKEAAIAVLSDAMVSSVMYLFEKNKNAILDYKQIYDVVLEKQLQSGVLNYCELSMNDLDTIKNIFVEETLYYDFLR